MDSPGFLALLVHSGPRIAVWCKDIVLRELR